MIYVLLVVVGLCMGSFALATVWRIHEQSKKKKVKGLSIINGRSVCENCRHTLGPTDLIPVISWLLLRGRCRYCGVKLSWQYPLIELITAFIFVFSYTFWPQSFDNQNVFLFILWLLFITGFIMLVVYDLRWYLLPTRIIQPLIALAVIQLAVVAIGFHGGFKTFLGGIFGALVIGGLFYGIYLISQGTWIGGGDVRLGVLLGLIVGGPLMSTLLIFLASVSGTIVSVPLLASKRLQRSSQIPFGPFLLLGAVLTRLFGTAMISWYKRHLLGV